MTVFESVRDEDRLFGPTVAADGTTFRLWAPDVPAVAVVVDGRAHPLVPVGGGFWSATVAGAGPGTHYAFQVGDRTIADPASRAQADTLEGPSVVVDPALFGRGRRLGRTWPPTAMVEVHVGTATAEGTFRALTETLDHIVDTGFDAIELMPVSDFPGRWNWGYDGVLPFAPARAYGRPEDLVALVDAAHARGLSIYLDVVYNHFGPSGNPWPAAAPTFFDEGEHTPWGAAIDFRKPAVRRYFAENARMWVADYGFDGLRFDAVHAYLGEARAEVVAEIAGILRRLDPAPHLIAENEHNTASILARDGAGAATAFDAQWNDDFHNALHVALTGETEGYYAAYADDPVGRLARVLAEGFAYQGEESPLRPGHRRGEPSAFLPPTAFVSFVQNHDQIGNRPVGDPLSRHLTAEQAAFARFLLLTAPQVPLMFLGEEWASERPFPFFCDFTGELADAVRDGRRREFKDFPGFSGTIPDPLGAETVESARRDWDARSESRHAAALADTRARLRFRRERIMPLIESGWLQTESWQRTGALTTRWRFRSGSLVLAVNPNAGFALIPPPTAERLAGAGPAAICNAVHTDGSGVTLGPWSASAWILS